MDPRCNHELAILRIKLCEDVQYWRSRNFVQKKYELRIHEQILEWFKNGTIEKASESSKYCSPIVCAPKKDIHGKLVDVRPCLDCRMLNKLISDIEYPQPKIRDMLDRLGTVSGKNA